MIDLNIIIVSWNCKNYLLKCIRSIYLYPPRCSYKITIVDNGSSDGTVDAVMSDFPDVYVIKNETNLGFASANNLVLKQRGAHYYLLLNPDTEVYANAIQTLLEFAERNPDAYGVGPKIVNKDGTHQITGVTFPNNWNILTETFFLDRIFPKSRILGSHKKKYLDWTIPQSLDYIQGSALLIKDKALEEIGLLDEKFFLFFEETDWCYRVKKAGKEILYCPYSVIKHYGGDEQGHYDEIKVICYHKSLFEFYRKHYKILKRFLLRIIIFIRCIIRIFLWYGLTIFKRDIADKAKSACFGYIRTLVLIFRRPL